MLIIQTPWSLNSLSEVNHTLTQAIDLIPDNNGEILVLFPHGDGSEKEAPMMTDLESELGLIAKSHNIFLCASSYVCLETDKSCRTVAFLFNPLGEVLTRTNKIMPDILEGYTETVAETYQPASFEVASTPHGQVGILCGEDILSPHIVRAMVMRGAEIILNPSRERSDTLLSSRRVARTARAYENVSIVAVASPSSATLNGSKMDLPKASAFFMPNGQIYDVQGSESVLSVETDIESLRRRRLQPQLNFAGIVRMNLYHSGYVKEVAEPKVTPNTRSDWIDHAKQLISFKQFETKDTETTVYSAMLAQHVVHQSNTPDELVEKRQPNLDDAFDLVRNYGARAANLKLVVFPEFFLTGPVSPLGSKLGYIADKIGVTFPGYEMDQIARFASEINAFVAGGVFEYDPKWPQRFFNTAFIYDPSGNLIHRYRKIHCGDAMGFLSDTTPGSVYDQYIDMYGYEYLFPVADTEIGRLATTICFDINFPETFRALANRGAEVILHPTSEPHGAHRNGWDSARRSRAFENFAYVLSCGHGGEYFLNGRVSPSSRARGYSKIINFDGTVQAEADTSGQVPVSGNIDLNALRKARAGIQANPLIWDNPIVYAEEYGKTPRGLPNNIWTDDPLGNPYYAGSQIKKVVDQYLQEGIFVAPKSN